MQAVERIVSRTPVKPTTVIAQNSAMSRRTLRANPLPPSLTTLLP